MLYELKKKQIGEHIKPFQHSDDEYYYIIHPDHIKNYISFENRTEINNKTCKNETNITDNCNKTEPIPTPKPPCKNKTKDLIEKKSIIYNDIDNNDPFPNAFTVKHEFLNYSKIKENNDNKSVSDMKSSFKENSNMIDKIKILEEMNKNILNKIMKPNIRFKENNYNNNNYLKQPANLNYNFIKNKKFQKGPYQVNQYLLDKVFTPNGNNDIIRYNQHPDKKNYLQNSKINPVNLQGNFIIDKNINKNNYIPNSLLLPDISPYRFINSDLSNELSYGPRFKQLSENFFRKEKGISPNFSYGNTDSTPINTDSNFYQTMNNKQKYTGFGKALLPPHPDDLYPPSECCMSLPCINKPICPELSYLPPPRIYSMNLPISFLEIKKITPCKNKKSKTFVYDYETGRRGRRKEELPDPEWDCLEKNIQELIHFICEQEVALSFTKFCEPILEQKDKIIEGFVYHDSNIEICQNIHMCDF